MKTLLKMLGGRLVNPRLTDKEYKMKYCKKVARAIDMLAVMPIKLARLKWDRASKVPKNIRRKIRYQLNKLDLEKSVSEMYRNFMIYGRN